MNTRPEPAHWVLAASLLVGLALRLWGLDFGLPHTLTRPDESVLVHRALAIAAGDLNPHFFNYPSLQLYLLAGAFGIYYVTSLIWGGVAGTQDFILQFFLDPSGLYLTGRLLTSLLGTATIGACYYLGRALGGSVAGAASALLLATAMLHVRDSHFLTVDVPAAWWMTAALAAWVRYAGLGRPKWLYGGAILAGLAMSTKYNAVLFLPAMLTAVRYGPSQQRLRRAAIALLVSIGAFVAGSPFIVLDPGAFITDFLFEVQHFGRGHAGQDLGNGWVYHLLFTLRHGLGAPLLIAALASCVWLATRRRPADLVILTAIGSYFAVAGGGSSLFVRYAIPLVPVLCAVTGAALSRASARRALWIAALLALPGVASSIHLDRLLSQPDTRELASHWIEQHVPAGERIAMSGADFGHPRLHPTAGWLQFRYDEVRRATGGGQRLRRALETPGYPPEPGYEVVALRPGADGRQTVQDLSTVASLQAAGIDWIVTQAHPLPYAGIDSNLAAELAQIRPVAAFAPAPPEALAHARFDANDAWYLPFSGMPGFERPGPGLQIYRLPDRAPDR